MIGGVPGTSSVSRSMVVTRSVSLTQCLRRLEASGLTIRSVVSTSPMAVLYEVSRAGASLEQHMRGILQWSAKHREEVFAATRAVAERSEGR